MQNIWDNRYASSEYIYGEEPNAFFAEQLKKHTPGKILLPAEGEGRNAVFAASLGWEVYAFDSSKEAIKKAGKLAHKKGVTFSYVHQSVTEFSAEENFFDAIGLIYAHQPPETREIFHKSLAEWLKPGGTLILEAFSKNQIQNSSGGPPNVEMLYDVAMMKADFSMLNLNYIEDITIYLEEGKFHLGKADVVRMVGRKKF